MTIKQELLSLGMTENQISIWQSDLYVLRNSISEKWLSTYEFKQNVKTFKSNIDGFIWYDIPFGYMDEFINKKRKNPTE